MAENKGGRDQDAVTGSGYFDKSLESLGTAPPTTIREIREQAASSGQQSATTANGDFED